MEEMASTKKSGLLFDEKEKKESISEKNISMEKKKFYTYNEAFQESLKYFKGDELAARVWMNKYALKDSYGNLFENSPDMMHRRIASDRKFTSCSGIFATLCPRVHP